ncbi:MAG: PQQ-binding-like beta-propeller repeat protein [Blastocatellales bacterium]
MNHLNTPRGGDENPYVGPRPFETGRRLFGRDRETEDLYYLLSAERIVLLYSPSGAGKSSLIQAGLVPRLAGKFDVWGPTRVNLQPSGELPAGVNRYVRSAMLGLEQGIPESRRRPESELVGLSLADYVSGRPRRRSAPDNIVIIFDQFEEILTVDPLAVEAKKEFFNQLGELLLDPRIWALFALREDYLAPFDTYAEMIPTHLRNRFRLDLLGRESAREAIVNPARDGGREFADEAVEKLVSDLATVKVQQPDGKFIDQLGQHVEPLQLQVVCRRLWERMPDEDRRIDLEDVLELGNVTEALSGYYAGEVGKLAAGDDRTAREIREWVDEKLITADGIRSQVLRGAGRSEGLDNDLIARLINTHLIRAEQRVGAVWYELAHDRLIAPIREDNRRWFDSHLHQVQKLAKIWGAQDEPPGLLLAGKELEEARQWAARNDRILDLERRFIEKSTVRQEQIERERRQAIRQRRMLRIVSVLTVLAIAAAIVAFWQMRVAEQKERDLQASLRTSRGLLYVASQLQAWEAYDARQYSQAAEYLESSMPDATVGGPDVRSYDWYLLWRLMHDEKQTLAGHRSNVTSVVFFPDGRTAASGDAGGELRVWDTASGKEVRTIADASDSISSMALSGDGRMLAVGGTKAVRLFETTNWKMIREIAAIQSPALSLAFATGGKMLASGHADGTVVLRNPGDGSELQPRLEKHDAGVIAVSFSPDGNFLACGDLDGTVKVWDVGNGNRRQEALLLLQTTLTSLAFSPDGSKLAIAYGAGIISLRNAADRREIWKTTNGGAIINTIRFSPDGKLLASASVDGSIRLIDAATGTEARALKGHLASVRSFAFSPDGRSLVSGSHDHTVRIFDLTALPEYPKLSGHDKDVIAVRYSADGRMIASGSEDGTVALFDAGSRKLRWRSEDQGSPVNAIALSPDGSRLAGGAGDGKLRLWDAANGSTLWPQPQVHGESIKSVAFSTDGKSLASGSDDGSIVIHAASDGKVERELKGHEGAVIAVAFSPDGTTLASGGEDGSIRLWDFTKGNLIRKLDGHKVPVSSLSFSMSGTLLASGSDDQTVRLWDVRSGVAVRSLEGHSLYVLAVDFTPDERTLASVSDGAIWLWDVGTGKLLRKIKEEFESVTSVSFSPDGRTLAGGISNGSIHLWPGARDEQITRQCGRCASKR